MVLINMILCGVRVYMPEGMHLPDQILCHATESDLLEEIIMTYYQGGYRIFNSDLIRKMGRGGGGGGGGGLLSASGPI